MRKQESFDWQAQPGPPPSVLLFALFILVFVGFWNFRETKAVETKRNEFGTHRHEQFQKGWPAVYQSRSFVRFERTSPELFESDVPDSNLQDNGMEYDPRGIGINLAFAISICLMLAIPVNGLVKRQRFSARHIALTFVSALIAVACLAIPKLMGFAAF